MTALPDSIIQNGLFCCWKYEERNGRKTKVPYQPETGLGAKSKHISKHIVFSKAICLLPTFLCCFEKLR